MRVGALRHDIKRGILERIGPAQVRRARTHWHGEIGSPAPTLGREYLDRARQHGTGRDRIGRASHGDGKGCLDLVASVVAEDRGTSRQRHGIFQHDGNSTLQYIIRIGRDAGRRAVVQVTITPNLRGVLGTCPHVRLVAVLPMVVPENGIVDGDSNRDQGVDGGFGFRGRDRDCLKRPEQIGLR